MRPEYKLLSSARRPFRLGSEGMTTIYIYDVPDEIYSFLCEVEVYERDPSAHPYDSSVAAAGSLHDAVLYDLEISEDGIVAPGGTSHKYEVALIGGLVVLAETAAYNI